MNQKKQNSTKMMVLAAILTALVVVLQLLGSFIRFGMFSISLVLVPIVIGASICGVGIGTWLGFAFGIAVLLSGDASAFFAINPVGTVATVIVKGAAAGLVSGIVYKYLDLACKQAKQNITHKPVKYIWLETARNLTLKYLPVIAAAVICPIVNTGVFLVGCNLFFYDTVAEWGSALGYASAAKYMLLGLAGGNFLFELLFNAFLSPIIVRVLSINEKIFKF